ncbi:MAG: hypothetical protein ACRD4B_01840 [Acidobacteriota bacterium]
MTEEKKPLTPLQAVERLSGCDHLFLSPKCIAAFNEAFGTNIAPRYHKAQPNEPKGLRLHDGAKGALGLCATEFAERVSRELNTGFEPWQTGRGFRLRSACKAIKDHLLLAGQEI